jgi:hypothetical protein
LFLISSDVIRSGVCPPLDDRLMEQLLAEYVSQERRYVLGDWEPATLDGGQFVEAAARILYHQDSGKLSSRKSVDECLSYVEDRRNQFVHLFPATKSARHIARVLRTIYKFRSDRGAVHIDPEFDANQLDSKFVIECCKWVLAEILRVFWTKDTREVARAIREILRYEVPVVGNYDGTLLVQRVDCTAEEEILLLLYWFGEAGMSRRSLGRVVRRPQPDITRSLQRLETKRQVIGIDGRGFRLTDLGTKRVITTMPEKLQLPA